VGGYGFAAETGDFYTPPQFGGSAANNGVAAGGAVPNWIIHIG